MIFAPHICASSPFPPGVRRQGGAASICGGLGLGEQRILPEPTGQVVNFQRVNNRFKRFSQVVNFHFKGFLMLSTFSCSGKAERDDQELHHRCLQSDI